MSTMVEILETLTVAALVVFNGVLESKYFNKLRISGFSDYLWWPVSLLLIATFLTALAGIYSSFTWLMPSMMLAHSLLHIVLIIMLTIALVKFKEIPFNYTRQYVLARASLFFATLFEVFAFCAYEVYCVRMISF